MQKAPVTNQITEKVVYIVSLNAIRKCVTDPQGKAKVLNDQFYR